MTRQTPEESEKEIDAIAFVQNSQHLGYAKDRLIDYCEKEYGLSPEDAVLLAAKIIHCLPKNIEGNQKIKDSIRLEAIRIHLRMSILDKN